MPFKHNLSRRHKYPKARYKVTNWTAYNEALRNRGDVTIWFTEDAIANWRPSKTGARGRPMEYAEHAIQTALFIRQVYHLPLRQTEGFMKSIAKLLHSVIAIPDFSLISKRSISLPPILLSKGLQPGSVIIVDSTGLKVFGRDEWHQEKHDVPARRTWRKLHLAVDEKHHVLACDLTTPEVGDSSAVDGLLNQLTAPFETFIGDGAYDGDPVTQSILSKQPDAAIIVPPGKSAVCSANGNTQRDKHMQAIAKHGRIAWQKRNNFGLRSFVELAMQRYKRIFGNTLKARCIAQQKSEARTSAAVLNMMTLLGMPVSVKV